MNSSLRVSPLFLLLAFTTLLAAAAAGPVSAAPSWGEEFVLDQPDGQEVRVRIWGDEFYRVVESLEGYTLVRDPDTYEICYAELSGDGRELLSTGFRVGGVAGQDLGLAKHLRIRPEAAEAQARAMRDEAAAIERSELAAKGAADDPMPSTLGDVRGILLIIDFSDEPASISAAAVDEYANQPGYSGYGNNGSVRDYFHDVSNGALTYTNHVPTAWYRASQLKSYYDDCDASYGTRAREMVREALIDLNNQGMDFSQFDANGDGYIDAINCFYAGTTSCGWAKGLWPHSGAGLNFSADGVRSFRYQVTGIGTSLALATFCHENGHMIGFWPDLYDYDYSSSGVGRYCLMCSYTSNTNPQEPCAYLKDLAGWVDVVDLTMYQAGISCEAGGDTIYRYDEGHVDYYLIENRQRTGRDSGLPDEGLAIWHCDPTGNNDYEDQTPSLHYEVTLVQADGDWDLEAHQGTGDSYDLWAAPQFTYFGPDSDPSAYWWDGSLSEMYIEDISASAQQMTFTFNPGGGLNVPGDYATIQAALDAAVSGQEVVLAEGVYSGPGNRDLDFGGKAVTLRAGSDDPARTVLELQGAPGDEHRGFYLRSGETAAAVIEGITLRGGYAQTGGAILLDGASPTLRNLIFQDCSAVDGGALFLLASSPAVEGCTIHACAADAGQAIALDGGSQPVASRLLITACTGAGLPIESLGASDSVTIGCSDLFGNANGDWVGDLAAAYGVDGNFSADPIYCDEASGELTILASSPCAPGWHPDGTTACDGLGVGAGIVDCAVTLFVEADSGPHSIPDDSRAVAVGDCDGDGDEDIYVVNDGAPDVLLINDGTGAFTDGTASPLGDAGAGTSAAWADYDSDGDLDLYLAKRNEADILYRNEGGGVFTDPEVSFLGDTGPCVNVSWIDTGDDGLMDIYLAMDGAANIVYRNVGMAGNGEWYFVPVTDGPLAVTGESSSADWCDYDNDGDQDVLVVGRSRNSFLVNYGDLGFGDETGAWPVADSSPGSGADWGDIDNDGLFDVFIANEGAADVLAINTGDGFVESTDPDLSDAGLGRGSAWGDIDNDGLLDLYLARQGDEDLLLRNAGDGVFHPAGVPGVPGDTHGIAWADFDGDGALDLYAARDGENLLLRNVGSVSGHWLQVRLTDAAGSVSPFGAKVDVHAGDLVVSRDVQSNSGYRAQGSPAIELGLGDAAIVDSLIVRWPSGLVETYRNLTVDRVLSLTEGTGPTAVDDTPGAIFALHGNAPNPFNPMTTIRYELPVSSAVHLQVFDLRGRLVRSLRTGEIESAGVQRAVWDGRDGSDRPAASGTYFCRLVAGKQEAVRRMVLLK